MGERQDRTSNWLDELLGGAGSAVADLRTKLIDEAWFGRRAVGHEPPNLGWVRGQTDAGLPPRAGIDELFSSRGGAEIEQEMPDQDMDFDR